MPPKRALGDITNALRPSANPSNPLSKSSLANQHHHPTKPTAATKLRRTATTSNASAAPGVVGGVARRAKPSSAVAGAGIAPASKRLSPMSTSTTAPRRTSARLAQRAAAAAAASASVFPSQTSSTSLPHDSTSSAAATTSAPVQSSSHPQRHAQIDETSSAPATTVIVNSSTAAAVVPVASTASTADLHQHLHQQRVFAGAPTAATDACVVPYDDSCMVDPRQQLVVVSEREAELPPGVLDIDANDHGDCLAASQFAVMVHRTFRVREPLFMAEVDYMSRQQDVTVKMRAILIDWLVDVHQKFRLRPETLYLTVNIIDRFLTATTVSRNKLQLVGVTAMYIASKYEEIYAPEVNDFVYISDKAYTRAQVLSMEATMLNALRFEVTLPYSLTFLRRTLKAVAATTGYPDERHTHLAHYLIELALPDSQMLAFRPSEVAAAAVSVAGKLTRPGFVWDPTIAFHSGQYLEHELVACEEQLCRLLKHEVDPSCSNKLTAVKRKFNAQRFGSIASDVYFEDEGQTLRVLPVVDYNAAVAATNQQQTSSAGNGVNGDDEVFVDANDAVVAGAVSTSGASHMDICPPIE